MSRWGELIPHTEDYERCLCGCQDEESAEAAAVEGDPQAPERRLDRHPRRKLT